MIDAIAAAPSPHDQPPRAEALSLLRTLAGRYDPGVLDGRQVGRCLRIVVDGVAEGEGAWRFVFEPRAIRLEAEPSGARADGLLRADLATWREIARDPRAGLAAYEQGRLSVRHDLHLGVSLLAATSYVVRAGG